MRLLPFLMLGASLAAQTLQIGQPMPAYLFHQASQAIRPLYGPPGAATLGDPIATGIQYAWIAPNSRYALSCRQQRTFLLDLQSADSQPLPLSINPPLTAAWDRASTALAIHSPESGLSLLRLNESGFQWETLLEPVHFPAAVTAMAAAPDGILYAMAGDGIYILPFNERNPRLILAAPTVLSLDIFERDALAATPNGALYIRGYRGAVSVIPLQQDSPIHAAAFSPTGAHAILLDSSPAVHAVSLENASTQTLPLDFAPNAPLTPLSGGHFLLRQGAPSQPFYLVSASPHPRIYFVPAPTAQEVF